MGFSHGELDRARGRGAGNRTKAQAMADLEPLLAEFEVSLLTALGAAFCPGALILPVLGSVRMPLLGSPQRRARRRVADAADQQPARRDLAPPRPQRILFARLLRIR